MYLFFLNSAINSFLHNIYLTLKSDIGCMGSKCKTEQNRSSFAIFLEFLPRNTETREKFRKRKDESIDVRYERRRVSQISRESWPLLSTNIRTNTHTYGTYGRSYTHNEHICSAVAQRRSARHQRCGMRVANGRTCHVCAPQSEQLGTCSCRL